MKRTAQEVIAGRAAAMLKPGQVVSLGTGLPQQVTRYVPRTLGVVLHSVIGVLGYGSYERGGGSQGNMTGDDGASISLMKGGTVLHQADSFGMLRGGHVDVGVVEAFQVSEAGDLVAGPSSSKSLSGPGATVDMAAGARYLIAVMEHTTREGGSRLVSQCSYPMAGEGCVDLVVMELGVIEVAEGGFVLKEVARGYSVDEVRAVTEAPLKVAPDLKEMKIDSHQGGISSKVYSSAAEAVVDIPDGAVVMIDGFAGPGGMPHYLILALRDQGAKKLTLVSNTAGIARVMSFGTPKGFSVIDHSVLVDKGQVKKAVASFPVSPSPSRPTSFELAFQRGEVELELVPQGTLAERIRAGGFGIAAFYTPTGVGTPIAEGKETLIIDGREYVLERAIKADFALIRARKADTLGNLVYQGTSRNFNAVMAPAATVTVAEVDEIVEAGQLDPEAIVTPGVFVQRVVQRPRDFSPYEPLG